MHALGDVREHHDEQTAASGHEPQLFPMRELHDRNVDAERERDTGERESHEVAEVKVRKLSTKQHR